MNQDILFSYQLESGKSLMVIVSNNIDIRIILPVLETFIKLKKEETEQ